MISDRRRIHMGMEQLPAILMTWPVVLFVELSVVAFFVWAARDKKPNGR